MLIFYSKLLSVSVAGIAHLTAACVGCWYFRVNWYLCMLLILYI